RRRLRSLQVSQDAVSQRAVSVAGDRGGDEEIVMPGLFLDRRVGDKIMIGDKIVVTVTRIDRNKVRIGVEAPRDMEVFRKELGMEVDDGVQPIRKTGGPTT